MLPLFQHTGPQPFLDQANDAPVSEDGVEDGVSRMGSIFLAFLFSGAFNWRKGA